MRRGIKSIIPFYERTAASGFHRFERLGQRFKQSYSRQLIERLSRKNDKIIVDNVFVIDLASHYKISLTEKIDVLKQAIEKHCLISFEYYSARGKHENRIEPYRIVFKWSSWYVFGYNAADKRFKLYKLNRLWKLKTSQEYFTNREIPEGDLNYGEFLEARTIVKSGV